ncbi:uncharacterized protein [Haliotis cracherodii]|uniref:uncharacterized protein isoform X2 n=1 Tax=Haliotis cracherodii TaxID=6455 RepID=UPI0039EBB597
MARTKKQVLQATARKQQLLLEAEQRAARQAEQAGQNPARKGRPVKPETSTASSSSTGATKHVDPQVRPPGRPIKTPSPRKLKPLLEPLGVKEADDGKVNSDGSLYKKIILAPQRKNKVSEDVQADSAKAVDKKNKKEEYLDQTVTVNLDAEKEDNYIPTPVSGPVNMKKAKLTARKSTNALKKAEAQELLQSLTRKETEAQPNPSLDIPNAHLVQISPEDVGRSIQLNAHQEAFPIHKLYARKSGLYPPVYPKLKARKSIRSPSKGNAKKSFLTARKSFPPCTLAPEEVELYRDNDQPSSSSTPDVESVTVFPSIHEAVITLPKSETLPVALVCIKDIYKGPDPAEGNEGEAIKETPPHTIRRSNSHQSPRRSNERPKSPRRKSPKGDRKTKNIFEQFQNEMKEKGSRSMRMSPNKKGASQEVASTAISSAMKVLRSVSEKVDGRKRKSEASGLSPRKKSPRRNSLKGGSPDKPDAVTRRNSNSPARSPRSGKKAKEVPDKRRSGSASPRGERRIRSPSVKLQDDNVVYMPLVKKGKVSSKTSPNEFMLTLKGQPSEQTNIAKDSESKTGVIRQLDFVELCKEQIVKNIAETVSDDDSPIISGASLNAMTGLPIRSSSPKPSTSTSEGPSDNSVPEDIGVRSKGLLDLISKVDNRIKTALFAPLESTQCMEEEECSDVSSLNTSHNSDTLSHLVDQMEAETTKAVIKEVDSKPQSDSKGDVENDTVPPDVKCGELYRRLTGKVADSLSPSKSQRQVLSSPVKPPSDTVKDMVTDNVLILDKSEGCLLKKHLLSPVKSVIEDVYVKCEQKGEAHPVQCDPTPPDTSIKGSKPEETIEGKRFPLWRKLYRTKEPLPLEILAKAEKDCNVNKKSAFVSDELENYLEDVKKLNLKSEQSLDREEHNASPESVDFGSEVKEIEPDFDEVEGVLFVSFASKDLMDAHIAVEKKNHWDKDANHLLGVSRLLSFEKEKQDGDSPEQGKAKTPSSLNLRGQHMKWKKYKRMLKEEFENLQLTRERGDPYSVFRHPEKTSDITKIKGWRNKFVDMEGDAGKLHWRTEERLLRNLEPDDIKALGIKKKRRKNIVFTHRKGTSKDIGYPAGRTSIYGQSGSPEEIGDNWDMMMEEYEEPLYGDYGEDGSDHTDEEMRSINWSYGHSEEGVSLLDMDSSVRDRPFGYAKRAQVRNEFAELFCWGEEEMKIMKNLGGRVRNRRKKNDPRDMTSLLRDSESPEMKKKFRLKMKVKRSDYIPVAVITEQMALDATCALDCGIYKPTKAGTGCTDNIMTKTMVLKTVQPAAFAGRKLLNKGSTLFRAQRDPKRTMLKSGVPTEYVKRVNSVEGDGTADGSLDNHDSLDEDGMVIDGSGDSKRPCDKPGCRYGCICHLCNDNQEDLEPRSQESHTCNKEYCRLGCICDSLVSNQDTAIPFHCGKPECMIECVCSRPERRSSAGATSSGLPDDGANSSDEIPPLIQDSDVSAEGSKFENQKAKEDKPAVSKTWSRHPKGDKYSNLPKRESRHRMSKNLDAITRKALMVYETSEVYCEQSGRSRKKHTEEISPGSRAAVSKLTSPTNKAKGPVLPKVMKRKPSLSQEVVQISDDDDDDNTDVTSCARSAAFSPTKTSDRNLSNDPTVVRIEKTENESDASSISVTPGGSRPGTPGPNPQDLGRRLAKVAIDCQNKDGAPKNSDKHRPHAAELPKRKPSRTLPTDLLHAQWHTQMVCLKANPKPKETKDPGSESEPEEIKLLEFMANCNWDNAKPQILSRVAQCLSRGVYPDPRRMVIGDFIVEIMPKAEKCAVIPPELKGKLPEHMYSIRVKVMRKASESDIKKFQAASAAAHLKQHRASLNKPRDSFSVQSCDTASRRIFKNTSYGGPDKNGALSHTLQKTLPPTPSSSAPPSAATSSAAPSVSMGISGFNRLQISHPSSTFMESSGNSTMTIDGNRSEIMKLNDISGNRDAESDSADIEHITVQNTETGDSISMVVGTMDSKKKGKKPEKEAKLSGNEPVKKKNKAKLQSPQGDVVHESKPKILKGSTTSSLDKLGKIPLSGPVDEKFASIFGCVEESPGGAGYVRDGEVTIDLTDDNVETSHNDTHDEPEQLVLDPKSVNPPGNGRNEASSVKILPSSADMKHVRPSTPKSFPPIQNQTFQIRGPAAPPIGQILVPVPGPTMQTAGSQIILAGAPVATNVSTVGNSRPTKTIISTPGGKLYGPFTDINDVKMLQVKNPDGTTQPLLRFLPANSFPIVPPAKSVGSQGSKITKSLLGTKYIPGPHGTILRLEEVVENKSQEKTKVLIEEDAKPSKKRRRKKNVDPASAKGLNALSADEPSSRGLKKKGRKSDQSNSVESFDEVDGSSGSKVRKGGSKSQPMATGKCPVGKDIEKKVSSETHLVTSLDEEDSGTAQQTLNQVHVLQDTADKENKVEYCEAAAGTNKKHGDGDKESSQKKVARKPGQSTSGGAVDGGLRQARSLSLDSPDTIKTSTPNPGAYKIQKTQQGFLPVKRQRSDSDSAAFADSSKRIKLVDGRPSSDALGSPSQILANIESSMKLTPIQKFKGRMNLPVIDISDDDSQMSLDGCSISGHSLQGQHTINISEEEKLDVLGGVDPDTHPLEDARETLYRQLKEDEEDFRGEVRERKTNKERARRQDILCMFMYLYNSISEGEDNPPVTLSRQKVLDAALMTIECEKQRSAQLIEDLKMEKFYRRAQRRRLRVAVDGLLKKGISAKVIGSHLEEVKQQELKRHSKRHLLRKIIKYGMQKSQDEKEVEMEKDTSAPSPSAASASIGSPSTSLSTEARTCNAKETNGNSIGDKLRAAPGMKVDPNNPSCFWSESEKFVIEIEKDDDEESVNEDIEERETTENVLAENVKDITDMKLKFEKVGKAIVSEQGGTVEDGECVKNSGKIPSMQNSPVQKEKGDIKLREKGSAKSGQRTLQRSNSEEAILQVESFIENAARLSYDCDDLDVTDAVCDDKSPEEEPRLPTIEQAEKINEIQKVVNKPVSKTEENQPVECLADEMCVETLEREKSPEKDAMFSLLLPSELNFDDASVESVPLESKTPSENCSSEATGNLNKVGAIREISQSEASQGSDKTDTSSIRENGKSGKKENFLICDVRGLAKNEFFCTK